MKTWAKSGFFYFLVEKQNKTTSLFRTTRSRNPTLWGLWKRAGMGWVKSLWTLCGQEADGRGENCCDLDLALWCPSAEISVWKCVCTLRSVCVSARCHWAANSGSLWGWKQSPTVHSHLWAIKTSQNQTQSHVNHKKTVANVYLREQNIKIEIVCWHPVKCPSQCEDFFCLISVVTR